MKSWNKWINERNGKIWISIIIAVIEIVVTIAGSWCDWWGPQINAALVFAAIMFAYMALFAILNKDNLGHQEMRDESKKEHDEIKGALSLYKDIESLSDIVDYEGRYVKYHNCSDVEMWIISNNVAEPDKTIDIIYKNLIKGVKYYYVLPRKEVSRCEDELIITFDKIKRLNKDNKDFYIQYLTDDLFDLMPIDRFDVLFYCNPQSTDHDAVGLRDDMKVFISFQSYNDGDKIYYKPVILNENQKQLFFMRMKEWRKRNWTKLNSLE